MLLTNAILIDPEAGTESAGHVHVHNGLINEILPQDVDLNDKRFPAGNRVECGGKYLAPGIIDLGVKVCEPGERHKESFRTAGAAAAAGGVTTMVTRPDTIPVVDTPETLEFAKRRGAEAMPVRMAPMAALTKEREGREMVEMGFLQDAGAVCFTDGDVVVRDTKVLSRAMVYARSLGALVMGHPQEPVLSDGAAVTSGKFASLRGLPGVSPLAERMGLERDLALVEATGCRYHADQISTAAALPALERAKQAGLDVTAGVSIHHLTLNELDVGDYRTFFKVKPPLRS
ncbi:MAG: dihydroorotase, partial [Pseudomonadota bacterium]